MTLTQSAATFIENAESEAKVPFSRMEAEGRREREGGGGSIELVSLIAAPWLEIGFRFTND